MRLFYFPLLIRNRNSYFQQQLFVGPQTLFPSSKDASISDDLFPSWPRCSIQKIRFMNLLCHCGRIGVRLFSSFWKFFTNCQKEGKDLRLFSCFWACLGTKHWSGHTSVLLILSDHKTCDLHCTSLFCARRASLKGFSLGRISLWCLFWTDFQGFQRSHRADGADEDT